MKNVRLKGWKEVNCKSMNATYASNGPGNTGRIDPMIPTILKSAQRTIRTISIQRNEKLKMNNDGMSYLWTIVILYMLSTFFIV